MTQFGSVTDILILVVTLVFVYIVAKRLTLRGKRDGRKYVPSVGCLPIIGSVPYLPDLREMQQWCLKQSESLGPVFSFQVGKIYTVMLASHEAIREALVQRSVDYADRVEHFSNRVLNPNAKGIVFHQYNDEFKKYHQLSLSILREFGFGNKTMETRIHMEIEEVLETITKFNGQPFDPKMIVTHAVHNIINRIVFGRPMDDTNGRDKEFLELVDNMHEVFMSLLALDIIPIFQYLPNFRRRINKTKDFKFMLHDAIDKKEKSLRPDSEESFVTSFIKKEGSNLDTEQLRYTVMEFVGAGSGTTSATILFAIVLLTNYPDVQERMKQEIDSVVSNDRPPYFEDLRKMPYVEASILEIMRFKTVSPLGLSHKTARDTEVGGYFIPKNTMVFPVLYAAHMNERTWTDPTVFRPDRFMDAEGNIINKELVISFSIGKRSCIGELMARQEVFQFIACVLQKFHIRPPEGSDKIYFTDKMEMALFPSPYNVRFLPRTRPT